MPTEAEARELVRSHLERHTERLKTALRHALAEPIALEPGRRLQFELDPWFQAMRLCANDAEMLPADWLTGNLLKELSDEESEQIMEVVNDMVLEWLGVVWVRVGGPRQYAAATAFLHGYPEQFDLEQGRWLPKE